MCPSTISILVPKSPSDLSAQTLLSLTAKCWCKKSSGRLISDVIEISDWFNIEEFQIIIDIKKAFETLAHYFLSSILTYVRIGKNFITWIEILLKDQLSCVRNGVTTIQYFNLEEGACESKPISAYVFILILKYFFLNIKSHPEMKGIETLDHCFLYSRFFWKIYNLLHGKLKYLILFFRFETKSNKIR